MAVGAAARRLRHRLRRLRRARLRRVAGGDMTRLLGVVTAALLAVTAVMALVVSPPDAVQGDAVRLLYVHVPTAWVAMYLSLGVTSLASALLLLPLSRRLSLDILAGASAEIGVEFIGLR